VWPHDTAIAVAGLRRAGFDAQATKLAGELFAAAQTFPDARLPELFCGFGHGEVGLPVLYPGACAPQAWAAAAPLMILRALLGIRPCAAEHRLDFERPLLPDGLASLTLSGLRIGDARVDLRCHRRGSSTRVEVTAMTGELRVAVQA
jgi:glycogen debranching enzyme